MSTAYATLLAIVEAGGYLDVVGDRLRTRLPEGCPDELKAAIRHHRDALMALLARTFVLVRSDTVGETVAFVPDVASREALIEAGADPGIIYARAELQQLVHRHVTLETLPAIHTAKKVFGGRIFRRHE